jgi:hypothetical protein
MPTAATDPLVEVLPLPSPDLAELVEQVRERIRRRMDTVTLAALTMDLDWKRNLVDSIGQSFNPEQSNQLICDVAIFRDRWGIVDSPLPLGPIPTDYEWEQRDQQKRLQDGIDRARTRPVSPQAVPNGLDVSPSQHVVLTGAGWQL